MIRTWCFLNESGINDKELLSPKAKRRTRTKQ